MKKSHLFQKVLTEFAENQKQVLVIAGITLLLVAAMLLQVTQSNLSASVTNLGGYGYGQTNPTPSCKTAEIILACALGTQNCPAECKTNPQKPDGYGYGQTNTGLIVDCKKAETILACAINLNCPAQCKPDTKKPDWYGYGQITTGPVIPQVPLCKKAEVILACALGTKNCPAECKPDTKPTINPRVIFPPKRR